MHTSTVYGYEALRNAALAPLLSQMTRSRPYETSLQYTAAVLLRCDRPALLILEGRNICHMTVRIPVGLRSVYSEKSVESRFAS